MIIGAIAVESIYKRFFYDCKIKAAEEERQNKTTVPCKSKILAL